jgi:predicted SAM-dependent methyltransferase
MEIIEFSGDKYPKFQTLGNASQFSIPFAKYFCKGYGYDIGFCKEEWKFPNAKGIDLSLNDGYHANNLPDEKVNYIYSSHCLEHVDNWSETLEYWINHLHINGIIFLYLPDYSQKYWRPWNNKKHKHCLTPELIKGFLNDHDMDNIFVSGIDLNNSFMVVAEKKNLND